MISRLAAWLADVRRGSRRRFRSDDCDRKFANEGTVERRRKPRQYELLLREAKARFAEHPLAGARDLAIVMVLGDAGLRREEPPA